MNTQQLMREMLFAPKARKARDSSSLSLSPSDSPRPSNPSSSCRMGQIWGSLLIAKNGRWRWRWVAAAAAVVVTMPPPSAAAALNVPRSQPG